MGRTVVGEILIVNDKIRELISEGASLNKLKETALLDGMVPMRTSGLRKVADGTTSIEEILRLID
jgi:type II secretory ATPase GspE/PulE/Tfp pilus assembly ATPase PilB-like protein